jgi:hypothetical protein
VCRWRGFAGIDLDELAQVQHQVVERARGQRRRRTEELAHELRAADHLAGSRREQSEQARLGGAELIRLAARTQHAHRAQVDALLAEPQLVDLTGTSHRAAQQRVDAQQQLAQVEGLGEVVVGAQFEAADAVLVASALRREDQHGRLVAARAQLAQHFEAIDLAA